MVQFVPKRCLGQNLARINSTILPEKWLKLHLHSKEIFLEELYLYLGFIETRQNRSLYNSQGHNYPLWGKYCTFIACNLLPDDFSFSLG